VSVVVDLGCMEYGSEVSVAPLLERFAPSLYLGFDPHPECRDSDEVVGTTLVVRRRRAAWTNAGSVYVVVEGTRTRVATSEDGDGELVPCFDLCQLIRTFAEVFPGPVVKMDVEGAEHLLVRHLVATDTDRLISRLLVEWHGPGADLLDSLRCPWEPW